MESGEGWKILVVDDEPAIHQVTKLGLKRKSWKGRPFELHSSYSAQEARELLDSDVGKDIQVAMVDVVMETDSAGLELCQYIRDRLPPTVRIVLRTGQPGKAPEIEVLETYDVDYYLAKSEATVERIFAVLRACLLASEAIRERRAAT